MFPEEDEEEISNKDVFNMIYFYYKENKLNKKYSETTQQLINYLADYEIYKNEYLIINENIAIDEIDNNDKKIIDNLKYIIDKLEKNKAFKKTIQNFKLEYSIFRSF